MLELTDNKIAALIFLVFSISLCIYVFYFKGVNSWYKSIDNFYTSTGIDKSRLFSFYRLFYSKTFLKIIAVVFLIASIIVCYLEFSK